MPERFPCCQTLFGVICHEPVEQIHSVVRKPWESVANAVVPERGLKRRHIECMSAVAAHALVS
jgi:hypothetical protein